MSGDVHRKGYFANRKNPAHLASRTSQKHFFFVIVSHVALKTQAIGSWESTSGVWRLAPWCSSSRNFHSLTQLQTAVML